MTGLMPHGDFTIKWQGNILLLYASGNYNLEGAQAVNQAIQASVLEKNLKHWAHIDIVEDDVLGGPEVISEIESGIQWCQTNGCYEVIGILEGLKAKLFKRFFPSMTILPSMEKALKYLVQKETNLNEIKPDGELVRHQ